MKRLIGIAAALVVGCGGTTDGTPITYETLRAVGLTFRTGDRYPAVTLKAAALGSPTAPNPSALVWRDDSGACSLQANLSVTDPEGASVLTSSSCVCLTSVGSGWAELYINGAIVERRDW